MFSDAISLIQYIDLFGTRCTFYSEKMPKLYTITGGLFTILSIFVCVLTFVIFSFDDIYRKYPNSTTSFIPSEGYRKIKFGQEKIWIPWRIVDYNNNEFVNHSGLLYPIIYYYSGIKNEHSKDFNLSFTTLNYTLCNETSMSKNSNLYQITVSLNELYCIDMDDLDMGGSWISEFINYIQFDLYYCADGINYDEANSNCTTFKKIIDSVGKNNSLKVDIYYPIVQFQPSNKTSPVIVIYRNIFYHISRYVHKINRMFLQENVMTDDSGWFLENESNNSYWGLTSFNGDTYINGNENDLVNEGSNSRAYSINIYLEPGIVHYKRYYKKIYNIFSDFYPFGYFIFLVMKAISKLFKSAETNKKMIELLFENLKEKPNVFEENLKRLKNKNEKNIVSKFNNNNNEKMSFNSLIVNKRNEKNKIKGAEFCIDLQKMKNKVISHHSSFSLAKGKLNLNSNSIIKPAKNNQVKNNSKFYQQHKKSIANNESKINLVSINKTNFRNSFNSDRIKNLDKNIQSTNEKNYIKQKLFPYKYYLLSVFIKNSNPSVNCFFSSRFAKIYTFLCQLFDITTYLSFQREFNALKKIFSENNINLIEKTQKININTNSFLKEISDCIGEHKFYILAQGIKKK